LCRRPGSEAPCSVEVPAAGAARAALAAGAGDLVLDGADDGALGRLRDALTPASLAERVTIPPGVPLDRVRETLARPLLKAYLDRVDASGLARPDLAWAPGRDVPPPVPPRRLSAAWSDRGW